MEGKSSRRAAWLAALVVLLLAVAGGVAFLTLGGNDEAKAQTVRFHLGLLLLWSAQLREARRQLQLAESQDPQSLLGRQAAGYLKALRAVGTR